MALSKLLGRRRRAWFGARTLCLCAVARRRPARIGARTLCLCAVAASIAGIGSCGAAGGSTVTVAGTTLTIYSSLPAGTPDATDVLDAERLALRGSSQIGKFAIKLRALTDTKISDNARTAIEDSSTIAYLGELVPGASRDSVGITNGGDVLQVSPGDTALELTQATAAIPGAPGQYYEARSTYGQTFARVVPSTAQEAKAQVQEMQALGVSSLYVADDGSQYGAAIALAVKDDASKASLHVVTGPATGAGFTSANTDALFYGGSSAGARNAAVLFGTVAKEHAGVKLFVPSALDSATFASSFGSANLHVYISSPGFLPKDLTPLGKQFVSDFTAAYAHPPASQAIFGYEAMKAVLAALQTAGTAANDRSTVVKAFFAIKNRSSGLGTYSIASSGDTTLAPYVFSRLRAGTLVPFVSVAPQG